MLKLRVTWRAYQSRLLRSGGFWDLFAVLLIFAQALSYSTHGEIRVNEVMSSNGETLQDENGDSPDWVELFNAGSEAVNLEGYGLSDNANRPLKWIFGNTTIAAGGYLVVFASDKDRHPIPATPMNPSEVAGLQSWLDASRISTNDSAQVRRSGVLNFVRRWADATGKGNDASQSSDTSQPALIQDFKGRPAVRFDGASDILLFARPLATNNFSIIAVYRTSQTHEIDPEGNGGVGGVGGQRYLFGAQHGGDFNAGAGISVGSNGVSVYEHGSSYMPALAVYQGEFAAGPTVLGLFYNERQPDLELRSIPLRNGVISARAQVTAPVEIGAGAYGSFNGDVAEILLYDRTLTTAERRGVAGYFMEKYGIESAAPHHTNFELSSGGEEIVLTRPDGTVEDHLELAAIPRDVSYGRDPANPGTAFFYAEPTPGESNNTPGSSEFLSPPEFSHAAGFYTQAVTLAVSIQNAGAEVRYTLDGSEPTPTSQLYSAPITLGSRNGTPNDISMIPTVPGGPTPSGEVFKGWIVRARAFKASALPSTVATRSYFIDPRGRGRYSVPVISLSTHRNNFFDNEIGIYVPGNAPGGNYSQKSDEWQRPVYVEFIETNNVIAFSQEGDVKIHGNTSQNFPIKGLDLDGTGGRGRQTFNYKIFPDRDRTEFEHFLLRPSGHDHHMSFMRDEMMQSLGSETGAESQAARACVVFLNGEYWGLHYLKEKEDTEFVSYYGNVPMDGVDFLEGYATAKAGDITAYQSMIQYIGTEDVRLPEVYTEIEKRMDVANYINYKVTEIFFYRWDIGNHRLWRPRTPEGKFRWLQFDNDVGWGGFWSESPAWSFNMLNAVLTPSRSLHDHNNETTVFLLSRLMANPTFRTDFINRFADLLNTLFLPSYTTARINSVAAPLIPEMAEHTRRWRAPGSLTDWRNHVEYLRTYATNRPPAMRQHIMSRFGLTGTAQVNLSVNNPVGGTLQLNSLTLTSPTNAPWTGTYFRGNPITLTARAKPGFHFAGWKGLLGVETNKVFLSLNGNLTLTADFEADSAPTITRVVRASNEIQGVAQASPGASYRVEYSHNLKDWTTINVVIGGADGVVEFGHTMLVDNAFYRLRFEP